MKWPGVFKSLNLVVVSAGQENSANNTTVVNEQATILTGTTKLNSTTVTTKHVTSTATVAQASPAELTTSDKRTQDSTEANPVEVSTPFQGSRQYR